MLADTTREANRALNFPLAIQSALATRAPASAAFQFTRVLGIN